MEVGKLLSKWWFVALLSLGIGGPLGYLALTSFMGGSVSSVLQEMPFPSNVLLVAFDYLMFGGYLISFLCLLLIVAPRHVMGGGGFPDPDALLRVGYEVRRKENSFDVRVGKLSTLRFYDGGRTFRCLPAPSALWALVLLSLCPPVVISVLPLALLVHVGCWKGLEATPRKENAASAPAERSVEEMVRDSLTRAYMLSREAAETKRSKFHDHSLILIVISLVAWTTLLVISATDLITGRPPTMLGAGTLIIAVITIIGVLVLRKSVRYDVAREEEWGRRLLSALRSERGEGSPIQLLLEVCAEVPRWLEVNRKGIWSREPGMALLIFLLLYIGANAMMQYDIISWWFFLISMGCFILGTLLFSYQLLRARSETLELSRDWQRKMEELGGILGTGWGRLDLGPSGPLCGGQDTGEVVARARGHAQDQTAGGGGHQLRRAQQISGLDVRARTHRHGGGERAPEGPAHRRRQGRVSQTGDLDK